MYFLIFGFLVAMWIFFLFINFLNETLVPMHPIMGLFELNETTKQSMLDNFGAYWGNLVSYTK
jgi:hypothetical protein